MRGVHHKVFASFYPLAPAEALALSEALEGLSWLVVGEETFVFREGDMLRLSFEGQYFPVDEALELLDGLLPESAEGRFDAIDMDAWTITRHLYAKGKRHSNTRSLNDVLEYSGH